MLKELKVLRVMAYNLLKICGRSLYSDLFRGRPVISADISEKEIKIVAAICPVSAINEKSGIN